MGPNGLFGSIADGAVTGSIGPNGVAGDILGVGGSIGPDGIQGHIPGLEAGIGPGGLSVDVGPQAQTQGESVKAEDSSATTSAPALTQTTAQSGAIPRDAKSWLAAGVAVGVMVAGML